MVDLNRVVKEIRGKNGTTHCALLAPSPALASCVHAYLTRNTLAADLVARERRNHFPPTPTCLVIWVIQGADSRVEWMDFSGRDAAARSVAFSGPHTQASVSDNPGPVHFFTLLIYPDALRALTGLNMQPHVNRYSPFFDVFDSPWQHMARAVFEAPTDDMRVQLIEDFLIPRWQALPLQNPARPRQLQDWSRGVAVRAAQQGRGNSDRQVDRRIKSWTGQALRQLRSIGRAEDVLLKAHRGLNSNDLQWAAIAAESGFSDQAHLCREFRRVTGLRPHELKKIMTHESYWLYQVWDQVTCP